jgi:transposase
MDTPFVPKGYAVQTVEARYGAEIGDILRRLYVTETKSQQAIADELGVERKTVIQWMKRYGIATRDRRALPGEATA